MGVTRARLHRLLLLAGFATLAGVVAGASEQHHRQTATPAVVAPPQAAAPKPVVIAAVAKPVAPAAPVEFDEWLAGFRAEALTYGIKPETLDRELAGLVPDPRVIALDGAQPDRSAVSTVTFAAYRDKQLTGSRVDRGRRLASDLSATLSSIEAQFGVPSEILLAIWGKETSYGAVPGGLDVVRSLATLAHEGRRREFFTQELIAAIKLIETGAIDREALVGSWAGATGQTQFMPTSYLTHAADGNGDGRADIWGNRADTLASIAAYFVAKGWQTGEPWAVEVVLPVGFDRERVRNLTPAGECAGLGWRHSRWLDVGSWRALGVAATGAALPPDNRLATLIEPDGPGGRAYLTFSNYRPIMRYNCSNFYALTVSELAHAIGAAPAPPAGGATRLVR